MKTSLLVAALLAACATTAFAQNKGGGSTSGGSAGAILIDQAKAEAGGVTPNDAPGFPVTLTQPGTYRLTSNLVLPNANTTGVVIANPNATLDLNGFAIVGPVTCTAGTYTCTGAGTGDGIAIELGGMNLTRGAVTIANGTVRGAGRHGIYSGSGLNDGLRIERMFVLNSGHSGLHLAWGGVVVDSQLSYNAQHGVTGNTLFLQNNLLRGNGSHGVSVNFNTVGVNNVLQGNAIESNNQMRNLGTNLCGITPCP